MIHSLSFPADHHPCNRQPSSSQDEAAFRILKRLFEGLCLRLICAMAESVVGEPFKGNVRMIPGHPPVERVMQKQVTQQG